MSLTTAYAADITKFDRTEDGSLIVYGKATGPDVDLDEQVCDPAWLRKAMPEWMAFGNVREMHQPIVAGIGMELAEDQDEWYLKSEVVDEQTARKIEKGALKGYSIGIKNARVVKDATAPGGRICGGSIVEVSYVDRPCLPTATLMLAKMEGDSLKPVEAGVETEPDILDLGDDRILGLVAKFAQSAVYLSAEADLVKRKIPAAKRKQLAGEGKALDDGSYPIENAEDLKNAAILAKSGHGNVAAAKKLIARRAKELGVANPLANSDKAAEPDTTTVETSAPEGAENEQVDLIKSAVAEAVKPYEDRAEELTSKLASVEAELAELKKTPIPGGPAITAPPHMRDTQARMEKAAQAARFRSLAKSVTDRELAKYYKDRAEALDAAA